MTEPVSYLSSRFKWQPWKWDEQRNDELSGLGSGDILSAELSDPLWTAQVEHAPLSNSQAEEMDALIRALRGPQNAFLMVSPVFRAPRFDPTGEILGARVVRVNSISPNRASASFKGMAPNYRLAIGDKFAISYGANPTSYGFFEVRRNMAAADTSGVTEEGAIYPSLPVGIGINAVVTFIDPACRVIIVPGSYKVGKITGGRTRGGSFQILQKRR